MRPSWSWNGRARGRAARRAGSRSARRARHGSRPAGEDRGERASVALKIFRQGLEFAQRLLGTQAALTQRVAETMLHMVVNERFFRPVDDAFDGLKLLGELHAGAAVREHGEHRGELALRLLQTLNDLGMRDVPHSNAPTP